MKMIRFRLLSCIACLILTASCSSPLKSYHKAILKAPFDIIIVPGIPFENGTWESNIMKERVLWSYFLYSKGIARNVIYSGNAVYSPYVEGKIMALYALALGIPREHVFSETNAEHSTENLVYAYRMAKTMGFEKIAVATDPGQTAALRSFAWDLGLPVTFIPVVQDSLKTMKVDSLLRIDPSTAFVPGFVPLPKREDILTRTLGTMGLEMKEPDQK
ncbi:MAG: YdcF family protein [Bacteroidetes bacterium]|nr:YdcF family protein [Bacteroidota bacterium]